MDKKKYNVGVIGAGNLASSLVPALANAGHIIRQVISRTESAAMDLAKPSKADYHSRISELNPDLDIVFLAIPDSMIPVIASELGWFKGVLAHTSGSVDLDAILSDNKPRGVFYPLQTFSRNKPVLFSDIPVFIEGTGQSAMSQLKVIAESVSGRVFELNSLKRAELHLAAVFANNFSNFLLASSFQLAGRSGISPEVLDSLVRETFEKALKKGPVAAQTGPALRGDIATIKKHMKLLSFSPELSNIYKCLSDSIMKFYQKD